MFASFPSKSQTTENSTPPPPSEISVNPWKVVFTQAWVDGRSHPKLFARQWREWRRSFHDSSGNHGFFRRGSSLKVSCQNLRVFSHVLVWEEREPLEMAEKEQASLQEIQTYLGKAQSGFIHLWWAMRQFWRLTWATNLSGRGPVRLHPPLVGYEAVLKTDVSYIWVNNDILKPFHLS